MRIYPVNKSRYYPAMQAKVVIPKSTSVKDALIVSAYVGSPLIIYEAIVKLFDRIKLNHK